MLRFFEQIILMQLSLHRWIRISLLNLSVVAVLGVILRYKIAFALPFIDQKHLQHGHSHFAFAGWITQTIMVLMVEYLYSATNSNSFKKYKWVLFFNLITAYGMLVTFFIEGYGTYSIIFSTLSIIVSYIFAVMYWADLRNSASKDISHSWLKASLIFNAVSSLGGFALAIMMITKTVHQNWYLAAEYFYLHFQYNGWFFFSCMGLFTTKLIKAGIPQTALKKVFLLFSIAFVPAYLLSVLWVDFPLWIYLIIVLAAFTQVISWAWLLKILHSNSQLLKHTISKEAKMLLYLCAIALSIKLLLQLGSVAPSLSDLSYGFRPIIIGYLHLVLLGVFTIFLLGYMVAEYHISISKITITGIIIFTSGIIINEILLMIQGVTAMNYTTVPFINELLFLTALIMFTGLAILNLSQKTKK